MDDIQHHVVDPMEMCTKCFDCDISVGKYPYFESSEKNGGFTFKTTPGDTQFHKPYRQLRAFCRSCSSNHEGEIRFLNSVYSCRPP